MRLVVRMKVLRTMQATLLLGGAAWFLSSGQLGPAAGLVLGALLPAGLEIHTRIVSARALRRPFRTERVGRIEAAVPEGWSAHGDDSGLQIAGGETSISISWLEESAGSGRGADLDLVATGLIAAYAKGRAAHDLEPCVVRLLGVDARGRRAVFAGWELTVVEAYAVDVPASSAIVTVLAVRDGAVPEALIRRCVQSLTLTEPGGSIVIKARPRLLDDGSPQVP